MIKNRKKINYLGNDGIQAYKYDSFKPYIDIRTNSTRIINNLVGYFVASSQLVENKEVSIAYNALGEDKPDLVMKFIINEFVVYTSVDRDQTNEILAKQFAKLVK